MSVDVKAETIKLFSQATRETAMDFMASTGGPTALGIYLCLKYGDDVAACSHEIDPNKYIPRVFETGAMSSSHFTADFIASKFLSKWKHGPSDYVVTRKIAALDKYVANEHSNRLRTRNLKATLYGTPCIVFHDDEGNRATDILFSARGKIQRWLAGYQTPDFGLNGSFGPGSSTSVRRQDAHPANKILAKDVPTRSYEVISRVLTDLGLPVDLHPRDSGVVAIVPKKFTADRIIVGEADWGIFIQKVLGDGLRQALRPHGLNLDRGAERNRRLAYKASRDGRSVTADLRSASDSTLTALVRFLFEGTEILSWMDACRSLSQEIPEALFKELSQTPEGVDSLIRFYTLPGMFKYSSMGNGFTFELESMVFYSIALSCCEAVGADKRSVTVFGDDIIIATEAYHLLQQSLLLAGYTINDEKSFDSGYFRESCGSYYFNGVDVKPIYLKDPLDDKATKYKFANDLQRLAIRLGTSVRTSVYADLYNRVVDAIGTVLHIPDGIGDCGLVSYFDQVCPAAFRPKRRVKRDGTSKISAADIRYTNSAKQGWIEGFKIRAWLPSGRKGKVDPYGYLLSKIRRPPRTPGERTWIDLLCGTGRYDARTLGIALEGLEPMVSDISFKIEDGNYVDMWTLPNRGVLQYSTRIIAVPRWIDPQI